MVFGHAWNVKRMGKNKNNSHHCYVVKLAQRLFDLIILIDGSHAFMIRRIVDIQDKL